MEYEIGDVLYPSNDVTIHDYEFYWGYGYRIVAFNGDYAQLVDDITGEEVSIIPVSQLDRLDDERE